MTQDEIIRMALEAGFAISPERYLAAHQCTTADLERFAALVAAHAKSEQINLAYQQGYEEGSAHEREACAKVCEEGWKEGLGARYQGDVFAAAIRAKGNE